MSEEYYTLKELEDHMEMARLEGYEKAIFVTLAPRLNLAPTTGVSKRRLRLLR